MGTAVEVRLSCQDSILKVDFRGSAAAHPGNLNATEGVTRSAVLYALRLWLDEDLPLNEGLLSRVKIWAEGNVFCNPSLAKTCRPVRLWWEGMWRTSQRLVEVMLRGVGGGGGESGGR